MTDQRTDVRIYGLSKNFLGQFFLINIHMQKMTNLRGSENPQKKQKIREILPNIH